MNDLPTPAEVKASDSYDWLVASKGHYLDINDAYEKEDMDLLRVLVRMRADGTLLTHDEWVALSKKDR